MPTSATPALAQFIAKTNVDAIPLKVIHEAKRAILNWVGCAIGASRHDTLSRALAALRPFFGPAQASILGRDERVDILHAALLNGMSSHTFDFDDTHLKTIIHPAGPVASAVLALAERQRTTGRELVDAVVLGIDVECRIGNAIYPDHYDRGWHITGSTGMLGAAAACARMLKLDTGKTAMALGIAASQPIGVREQFGSMSKAFHIGGAARAGLTSALMARHGYTASMLALEAPRGLLRTYSSKCDWKEISDELGKRFEISFNTYKPFACGIVIHPSIDGCRQLRDAHRLRADDVERIDLLVHPLVLELTGKRAPKSGLEAKFSVYHACAAAMLFGQAGEAEFSDAIARRPEVIALRDRVHAKVDAAIDETAADVTIRCNDGRRLHLKVEHAIGSLQRPMSDSDLERKFHGLVDPILGADRAARLVDVCRTLGDASDVEALRAAATA